MNKDKIKALFPEEVETITMTRQDYDRHMENLIYENIELKQRIDKAIEILEIEKKSQELTNNGFCACSICHALDILKGSDNNE